MPERKLTERFAFPAGGSPRPDFGLGNCVMCQPFGPFTPCFCPVQYQWKKARPVGLPKDAA
ncbi:MAG: hypothetical protein PHQ75_05265 [Thermoguttaceae bacterium]|nr:hypothetical protein [Thermoguttaceae bacterium]